MSLFYFKSIHTHKEVRTWSSETQRYASFWITKFTRILMFALKKNKYSFSFSLTELISCKITVLIMMGCACGMLSCFSHVRHFGDTVDHSLAGSSAHGILLARILEWVVISFSRDLPNLGIQLSSHALAGGFPLVPHGKPNDEFIQFKLSFPLKTNRNIRQHISLVDLYFQLSLGTKK